MSVDFTRSAPVEFERVIAKAVTELEDGDLLIEGYAADWDRDRQGDILLPGAFKKSIDNFLATNPALLYHHQSDKQLGQVLELEEREDGLYMKAMIAKPAPGSWAEDVYLKAKRGIIKGLSVRGSATETFFPDGPKVTAVDLMEVSLTPFPVNERTLATVISKAFDDDEAPPAETDEQAVMRWFEEQFDRLATAASRAEERLRGDAS